MHRRTEANQWFEHLEHVSEPAVHNEVARRDDLLCCHRISFQETIEGEWSGLTNVPFDNWLAAGKARIGVSPRLEDAVPATLELCEYGLILDGSAHSEAYVKIQCAYPCCLESLSMLRPEVDAKPPKVRAASNQWSEQREEEAVVLKMRGGVLEGHGLPSEHMFVTPHVDQGRRKRELDVCDLDGSGIYVRVSLTHRREYALAELDLCFLDTDLGHEGVEGWCHEEDELWDLLARQNFEN